MMRIGITGSSYRLESSAFSSGGEGDIYRVLGSAPKKVAKIYKAGKSSRDLENKLIYMVSNPPDPTVLNQVAWPLDVLYDTQNKFCGFVMPELSINAELKDVYQYPSTVSLSARNKIIIAENICAVISAVHSAGYVFGDFNPRNIGVDKNSGKVASLDTDSYHVFDNGRNKCYRCIVCADGYAAPELLEACANHAASYPNDSKQLYEKTPLPTFTKETDNFALAIHIFKLLVNGFTPFGGIIDKVTPSQASPSMGNAAIRRNEYSFRPGYKPLSPAVPPLDVFPQEIMDLFTRAFLIVGTVNPSQRPTSIEWYHALSRYETTLIDCRKNKLHQYDGTKNKTCPFCEADTRYQSSISGNQIPAFTQPFSPLFPIKIQQKTYSQAKNTQPLSSAVNTKKRSTKSGGGMAGSSFEDKIENIIANLPSKINFIVQLILGLGIGYWAGIFLNWSFTRLTSVFFQSMIGIDSNITIAIGVILSIIFIFIACRVASVVYSKANLQKATDVFLIITGLNISIFAIVGVYYHVFLSPFITFFDDFLFEFITTIINNNISGIISFIGTIIISNIFFFVLSRLIVFVTTKMDSVFNFKSTTCTTIYRLLLVVFLAIGSLVFFFAGETFDTRWFTKNPNASVFTISTADELAGLAAIANGTAWGIAKNNFSGKTIRLTADIDLSSHAEGEGWVPIGNFHRNRNTFSGTFDGGGFTIRNLFIDRPDAGNQGLFGHIYNGRIENLLLYDVNIKGNNSVGGVVGIVLDNSSVVNSYSSGVVSGNHFVGGVVGWVSNNSSVIHSHSSGTVSGTREIGGVVGTVTDNSSVANSFSIGAVSGTGSSVGGVVGILANSSVTNNAALNPRVNGSSPTNRVVGAFETGTTYTVFGNVAFSGMINIDNNTTWFNVGTENFGGADISAVSIRSDGTIGGRFTNANGWRTQNGSLPGIGGVVAMPPHL